MDGAGDALLVCRRVDRDDGGDDVSVGGADGRALRTHDGESLSVRTAPFTSGYLVAWTSVGAFAFALATAGGRISGDVLAWDRAGRWVAAATLIVAAVYELTPLKDVCLGKCRSPLGFLVGAWRGGRFGALQMGARHGAWCIGCCWALMASLFALGVMSLVWMAVVAVLIAFEKLIPSHRTATYVTAGILLVLGVLLISAPDTIPALTVPGDGSMSQMDQMSP